MPDLPSSSTDDALLERLNALKKSSVSFDTNQSASITPSKASPPADELAARFARLGSASPSASPKPSQDISSNKNIISKEGSGAPAIAPGAPSYLEGIAEGLGGGNVEFNEEDEKSLEELLGRLGERRDWDVSVSEENDVGRLLKDIKSILPDVQKSAADSRRADPPSDGDARTREARGGTKKEGEGLTDWENIEIDIGSAGVELGREGQQESTTKEGEEVDNEEEDKKREDEEAEDIIARIMAELAIRKRYGDSEEPPDQDDSDSGDQKSNLEEKKQGNSMPNTKEESSLTLPSAPSTLPTDDLDRTQALEDALTARFASLSSPSPTPNTNSLGLPSAPSFSPTKKPPKVTSNLAKYTDEEIDSWCIICNDDATLKCLGCDGDLYCQNCWMEGHRGEDAGWEEQKHRAVIYNKRDKERKGRVAVG